jgi:hypothetical protein
MMSWHRWLGKPHAFAADPDVDNGCDCLIMVTKVRRSLGLPAPSDVMIKRLLVLARRNQFDRLDNLLTKHLVPAAEAVDGVVTIARKESHTGVAIVVEGGLLYVSLRQGVRWTPAICLRKLTWSNWQ